MTDLNKDVKFTFFASELGFKPGQWPEMFFDDHATFQLLALYHQKGEVKFAHYVNLAAGELAVVFND